MAWTIASSSLLVTQYWRSCPLSWCLEYAIMFSTPVCTCEVLLWYRRLFYQYLVCNHQLVLHGYPRIGASISACFSWLKVCSAFSVLSKIWLVLCMINTLRRPIHISKVCNKLALVWTQTDNCLTSKALVSDGQVFTFCTLSGLVASYPTFTDNVTEKFQILFEKWALSW